MRITKTSLAVDIAMLLIIMVAVEWLSARLTHTGNVWPLVVGWSIYLGVRVAVSSRKPRSSHSD